MELEAHRYVNPGPMVVLVTQAVFATTLTPAHMGLVVTWQPPAASRGAAQAAVLLVHGVAPVTPVISATTRTLVSMAPAFTTNTPAAPPGVVLARVLPGLWVALVTPAASAAPRIPASMALAATLRWAEPRQWELEVAATQCRQVDTRATEVHTRRAARTLPWAAGQALAVIVQVPEGLLPSWPARTRWLHV